MTEPPGGFCPTFGLGRPRLLIRNASRGLKRNASDLATSFVIWCKGVRSSKIQNERPCVATTRSSFLNTISWIGTTGRLSWRDCQFAPSSKETKTPVSVPAYRSPFLFWSSRTTRTKVLFGSPFVICFQDLP